MISFILTCGIARYYYFDGSDSFKRLLKDIETPNSQIDTLSDIDFGGMLQQIQDRLPFPAPIFSWQDEVTMCVKNRNKYYKDGRWLRGYDFLGPEQNYDGAGSVNFLVAINKNEFHSFNLEYGSTQCVIFNMSTLDSLEVGSLKYGKIPEEKSLFFDIDDTKLYFWMGYKNFIFLSLISFLFVCFLWENIVSCYNLFIKNKID